MKQLNYSLFEIKNIARQLWNDHSNKKVWAFHAAMGSGKTTLIHALCDVLEVNSTVSSPTFAIINQYKSPLAKSIYHMDWYRIKDETEAIQAGCEDCIESGHYCFIEWPEKCPQLLPENTLHIYIETLSDVMRIIKIA
ncbi:MAG: tRNA (adenosine(37)-N6)-threonylcarbamoyltransferase complex ATPase subunit type 1 TsaE [Parafilimonas sp.]|nr:tRNA (adenosine(37)-N6)-threonylcarbamoyltransferase complex ATPase subunit type 1 TsaE [Parafilimonas sp.]